LLATPGNHEHGASLIWQLSRKYPCVAFNAGGVEEFGKPLNWNRDSASIDKMNDQLIVADGYLPRASHKITSRSIHSTPSGSLPVVYIYPLLNLLNLMRRKTPNRLQFHRIKPKLRQVPIPGHVHMRWLRSFVAVKETRGMARTAQLLASVVRRLVEVYQPAT
jgi:hypothetical protein